MTFIKAINRYLSPQHPLIPVPGSRLQQIIPKPPKPLKITIFNPIVKPANHTRLFLAIAVVVSCALGIYIYFKTLLQPQITPEKLASWKFHFTYEVMKMESTIWIDPTQTGLDHLVSQLKNLRGKKIGDEMTYKRMPCRLKQIDAPAFNNTFTDFPPELEALLKT